MGFTFRGDGDGEQGTEIKKVEKEYDYTEHTAIAKFTDGTTMKVVFDVMNRNKEDIVLKDYTGEFHTRRGMGGRVESPSSEAHTLISKSNLRSFETKKREKKTMTYTEEKEVLVDES